MATHKYINRICCVILALTLALTVLFMRSEHFGVTATSAAIGYEDRLFDASSVHTINIVMEDWEEFLDNCTNEEYVQCTVIVDDETYKNVAIRAKGNTSLSQVQNYGNDRYSFKIEFDHYDSTNNYHGLDKLSLNNIIQDNTYMKDFLCYQMMGYFGVSAPLCSYVQILVNGEEWGLYLAVEGVEESFLQRNYGNSYGELYKPDSMSMGGGRGNGGNFNMESWEGDQEATEESPTPSTQEDSNKTNEPFSPDGSAFPGSPPDGQFPSGNTEMTLPEFGDRSHSAESEQFPGNSGRGMGAMGSSDVSLIYTDDNYDSYSNIFDNAKTDITDTDKDRLIASLKQLNENSSIEDVVNVEEVIRYFVVHNFVCNFDSYTGSMIHNYYLYEEGGQLSMIPWDYNLAFGGFVGGTDATSLVNYPIDSPVWSGTSESRPMLNWIFEDSNYTDLYHQYFAEFIASYFDSGSFSEMLDSVSEMIAPYVESDPTKFCTYEEFETAVATLKEFCLLRAESINGQLDGTIASSGEQEEATLIDASHINISDMGSMNGGMGMNRLDAAQMPSAQTPDSENGPEQNNDVPQFSEGDGQEQSGEMPQFSGGAGQEQNGEMPQLPSENGQKQSEEMPQLPSENGQEQNEEMPQFSGEAGQEQNGEMPQFPGENRQEQNEPNTDSSTESSQENDGTAQQIPSLPDMGNTPPEMPQNGGAIQSAFGSMAGTNQGETASFSSSTALLSVVSLVVLAAGLLFAFLYRKKG